MKFCVIGLGRLGLQLAKTLAENGMEVLAIDSDELIIASAKDLVTQALCIRIIDEDSLRAINIENMDTVIVTMGENIEQSILTTALLKKRLHIKNVIARAVTNIHKEILLLIGADKVVMPEQESGVRLADILSFPFMDMIRLTPSFSISNIKTPKHFIGSTCQELSMNLNQNIMFLGLKQDGNISFMQPEYVLRVEDTIVVAGSNEDLEEFARS